MDRAGHRPDCRNFSPTLWVLHLHTHRHLSGVHIAGVCRPWDEDFCNDLDDSIRSNSDPVQSSDPSVFDEGDVDISGWQCCRGDTDSPSH